MTIFNMPQDYYSTLGISRSASADEIKAAYRKLALKHHPDRGGGKEAEDKFKQVNEAYQVLSNPDKRAQYDRFGRVSGNGGMPTGEPNFGGFEFNFGGGGFGDIFESFFSQAFSTVQATVEIPPAQAVLGDRLDLRVGDETVRLDIPPGTETGAQFAMRGKGRQHQRGRGDLVITVRVKMPRRLSREQKRLWEELKKQGG